MKYLFYVRAYKHNSNENARFHVIAKDKDEIKKYIMRAIWPQATIGNWLQTNGYSDGHPCARDDYVIDYRRRWVDHMIKNHEEFFGKD